MTNLKPCHLEFVTFGDGTKGTMIGSGLLKVLGMPKLENVLLVDGLKTNLSTLVNCMIIIYLSNSPKTSSQWFTALIHVSWREKDC